MGKRFNETVQSKNVLEFITVVNELCLFLEEIEKYDLEFILAYLNKVLPLTYLKGTMMPDVVLEDEDGNVRFVTLEQWEKIYLGLLDKTGSKDIFYYIDFADDADSEGEKGSIAENLSDIYQDLKDFILLYQKNTLTAQQNAVHACKHLFETNWGRKMIDTQKAIHSLLYSKKKSKDDLFLGFSPN
ncbi:MAG TPA: DUF5063 domain-containing protein [Bacteroidales bacterium]|nr:DUF5063 domain-containing protein [Bacteroidales bacterium]